MTGDVNLTHPLHTALKAVGYAHALGKEGRAKARAEIRAAEAVIQVARDLDAWNPQLPRGLAHLHPQHRAAILAFRDALAALEVGQ